MYEFKLTTPLGSSARIISSNDWDEFGHYTVVGDAVGRLEVLEFLSTEALYHTGEAIAGERVAPMGFYYAFNCKEAADWSVSVMQGDVLPFPPKYVEPEPIDLTPPPSGGGEQLFDAVIPPQDLEAVEKSMSFGGLMLAFDQLFDDHSVEADTLGMTMDDFEGASLSDIRKLLKRWHKGLEPKKVVNHHTGLGIEITNGPIKHPSYAGDRDGSRDRDKKLVKLAVTAIPDILKMGYLYSVKPPKKDKAGFLLRVLKFVAPVMVMGERVAISVTVNEIKGGSESDGTSKGMRRVYSHYGKFEEGSGAAGASGQTPESQSGPGIEEPPQPQSNNMPESLDSQILDAQLTPAEIERRANKAATSDSNTEPEPTQAQKEAGNYKKGAPFSLHGLKIVIENPKGSKRSGTDPDGSNWSNIMGAHYGDIKGTIGADDDPIDVFVGESPSSERVWIIDQVHPESRKFDEHKVMLGFESKPDAKAAYLSSYDSDWQGIGVMTELNLVSLKRWLSEGDLSRAYAE